jgi:hypothetical protein
MTINSQNHLPHKSFISRQNHYKSYNSLNKLKLVIKRKENIPLSRKSNLSGQTHLLYLIDKNNGLPLEKIKISFIIYKSINNHSFQIHLHPDRVLLKNNNIATIISNLSTNIHVILMGIKIVSVVSKNKNFQYLQIMIMVYIYQQIEMI